MKVGVNLFYCKGPTRTDVWRQTCNGAKPPDTHLLDPATRLLGKVTIISFVHPLSDKKIQIITPKIMPSLRIVAFILHIKWLRQSAWSRSDAIS